MLHLPKRRSSEIPARKKQKTPPQAAIHGAYEFTIPAVAGEHICANVIKAVARGFVCEWASDFIVEFDSEPLKRHSIVCIRRKRA